MEKEEKEKRTNLNTYRQKKNFLCSGVETMTRKVSVWKEISASLITAQMQLF